MNRDYIKDIVLDDYKARGCYTPAKRIDMGDFYQIYVSGIQAPKDDGNKVITDDIEEQTKLVFEDIKAVIYVTDMNDFDKISKIRDGFFKNSTPVSTLVEVNRMTRVGAKIEIEVIALVQK